MTKRYSTSLSDWGEVSEIPEMGNTRLSCEAISATHQVLVHFLIQY